MPRPVDETDALFREVYEALRQLAGQLQRSTPGATLEPTALVHEAWLRMRRGVTWEDEAHFRAIAAKAMRQILADRARRRRADKRGGGWSQVTLTEGKGARELVDAVALHSVLSRLEEMSPRSAAVVTLRVFGGLSHAEVGEVLDLAERTVRQEWRLARAWLLRWLDEELP